MHQLEINIPLKNPEIVHKSIKPEIKSSPSKGSKIEFKKQKKSIDLKIESKDISSFRAAMNSWLRWIQVAKETSEIKKEKLISKD